MALHQHLEKIHGFLGVATYGSFRKASEMLAISQPSLSQSIALLEEVLGAKLFTRSSKGVELTSEGRRLYTFALDLMARTSQVENELTQGQADKDWTISIGTYESLAVHLWPQLLRYLQRVDQRLQINLITGRSTAIVEDLMDGFLDAALCVDPPLHPRLAHQLLYEDRYGIYARHEVDQGAHPNSKQMFVDKKTLKNQVGFVFSTASAGMGRTLEQMLWTLDISFKRLQVVQSFEATAALIWAGLGVGILPHRIASSLNHSETPLIEWNLVDCESHWGSHRIELCYLKDKQSKPSFKSFQVHAKTWIASLEAHSFASTLKQESIKNP
jgi:DNA-binding transcriptional LysR family regulator